MCLKVRFQNTGNLERARVTSTGNLRITKANDGVGGGALQINTTLRYVIKPAGPRYTMDVGLTT